MKEHPILFSDPMVRALLDGRKTQTRRMVTHHGDPIIDPNASWMHRPSSDGAVVGPVTCDARGMGHFVVRPRYGVPGDRLWVRETWAPLTKGHAYRSDGIYNSAPGGKWRPSIFLPRAASRILLEITDVRMQRLNDITHADAVAEGMKFVSGGTPYGIPGMPRTWHEDARRSFRELWDSINAKRATWDSNPWVWAITFRRIQ